MQIDPTLTNWKQIIYKAPIIKQQLLKTIIQIRVYLCQVQDQRIDEIISHDIPSQLLKLGYQYLFKVSQEMDFEIIYNIIWIFTNLLSGDSNQSQIIINLGIIHFIKNCFLLQNCVNIMTGVMECIGNLLAQQHYDLLLCFLEDINFYNFLLFKSKQYWSQQKFQETVSWVLLNCFQNFKKLMKKKINTQIYFEQIVYKYLPLIVNFISLPLHSQQTLGNLLNCIFYISENANFFIGNYIKDVLQICFIHPHDQIRILGTRIYGNLIANTVQGVTMALQNQHFLKNLFINMHNHPDIKFRSQNAWILSNLLAAQTYQIEKILLNPVLFNQIYLVLTKEQDLKILKQINWALGNLLASKSPSSFESFYHSSIIEAMSQLNQRFCQQKLNRVYIQGLQNYLKKLNTFNYNLQIFQHNSSFIKKALQKIQTYHPNQKFRINLCISQIQKLLQKNNQNKAMIIS